MLALLLSAGALVLMSSASAFPLGADAGCDGDFHVVKRFTRGRKTGVANPAIAGEHLWLTQTFMNKRRDFITILKRWDGSEWSRIRIPDRYRAYFASLDATSDGSLWLAGREEGANEALILRWDGERWHETTVPSFPGSSSLTDIDMWAANDGWAVGSYESGDIYRALALRWNGETWTQVPTPDEGHTELEAVSIAAPHDVWALVRGSGRSAMHWDGVTWTEHDLPQRKDRVLQPWDIEARSETEAWIVGGWEKRGSASALLAWDGSRWSTEPVKDLRGLDWLLGIEGESGVWTVGERRTRRSVSSIALRSSDSGWLRVDVDDPGRGGHFGDVVVDNDFAWATGRASSRKLGLFGVLQKACLEN